MEIDYLIVSIDYTSRLVLGFENGYGLHNMDHIQKFLKRNNCIFIRDMSENFIMDNDLYISDISDLANDGVVVFKCSKLDECVPLVNKLLDLGYCSCGIDSLEIKSTKNDKKVCVISLDNESG